MRVKGEGPVPAQVMLCGEGPGFMESKLGRPFVEQAPAGAELTRYLNGYSLPLRQDLFVTNLVKEWPGGSATKVKDVTPEDISRDEWELHVELQEVHPEIVVAIGRHSARWLLNADIEMEAIHWLLFEVRYCPCCRRRVSRRSVGDLRGRPAGAGGGCALCRLERVNAPHSVGHPGDTLDLPQLPVGRPGPGRQGDPRRRGSVRRHPGDGVPAGGRAAGTESLGAQASRSGSEILRGGRRGVAGSVQQEDREAAPEAEAGPEKP